MIEKPPPRPPRVAGKLDPIELQVGNLRRELDAGTEPVTRAAILYHIGTLYEHELGRQDDARGYYTMALDAAPAFQPAAVAIMRLAERDSNETEVAALCSARIGATDDPTARATALLDLGLRSDDWPSFLREAIARAPEPVVPALIFEWLHEGSRAPDALPEALRAQAEQAADPALRGALFIDLALTELERGEIDGALRSLDLASESPPVAWAARSLQRRAAKEHGRPDEQVRAAIAMAHLLEGEAPGDPLSLPVAEQERPATAALLWAEAADVSARMLGDLDAASRYLAPALELLPYAHDLRVSALLLAEQRRDPEAMDRAAHWFASTAPDDPVFVAYRVRRAIDGPPTESSLSILREAVRRYPDSDYAHAALDVALLRAEARSERIDRLLERAEDSEGEARALALWHAARLIASSARPWGDAQAAFTKAAGSSEKWRVAILRDALGAAIHQRAPHAILEACDDLLDSTVADDEYAELVFMKHVVTRHLVQDPVASHALLLDALEEPRCAHWASQVARAHATRVDDLPLLAHAHEAAAANQAPDEAAAHLCVAGHAYSRCQDWTSAERVLRHALALAPQEPHAVSLLENVLREGGRPEEILSLSRDHRGADSERSLLLAGATAERGGKLDAARKAYEEALSRAPKSASAALALADVASRADDAEALHLAYQRLAETDLGGGVPELFALLEGDMVGFANGGSAAASTAYARALGHPLTSLPAAIALAATPKRSTTEEQRAATEEMLADSVEGWKEPSNGFDVAYASLATALEEPGASSDDAWLQLAALAPTPGLRAHALLHGLREMRLARGDQSSDEAFLLAHESESLAAAHPEAAAALDETLAPGDEPELRVQALDHQLAHGGPLGRTAIESARCRALVEAGRGDEALVLLSNAIDERPDDLTLWENLRSAARQAGQWASVAQACERIAGFVDGTLRADLLEEAGAVRLDCLEQEQQAEDLFRAALDADPTRSVAFRRLHDLLTAREDADALAALVSERLALGGPKDRPELLYERARLLRGFSDRPGALEALDELFVAEPEHAGALALAAEVHVSLEQWTEAVDCLRRLSRSDLPDDQRRVAHLGAADFLETRLDQPEEALGELRAVETLGLADAPVWLRIGALEERLGRPAAAAEAYEQALEGAPTDPTAAARLADLLEGDARERRVRDYEHALWARIDEGALDGSVLEGLRRAAHWRGHVERGAAIAVVEAALDPNGSESGATDLAHVSMVSLWDRQPDDVVDELIRRVGPELEGRRAKGKKLSDMTPAHAELEQLAERFGARFGSVSTGGDYITVHAGRDGELHWVVPESAKNGLHGRERFVAGQLAWGAPRGANPFADAPSDRAAGTLAGVLRAARCSVSSAPPVLPAVAVKLRRASRKAVAELVGQRELSSATLLEAVQRLQRRADRAGLLACGDIGVALDLVNGGPLSLPSIRSSARTLDLLRFWMADDSPLWGNDA